MKEKAFRTTLQGPTENWTLNTLKKERAFSPFVCYHYTMEPFVFLLSIIKVKYSKALSLFLIVFVHCLHVVFKNLHFQGLFLIFFFSHCHIVIPLDLIFFFFCWFDIFALQQTKNKLRRLNSIETKKKCEKKEWKKEKPSIHWSVQQFVDFLSYQRLFYHPNKKKKHSNHSSKQRKEKIKIQYFEDQVWLNVQPKLSQFL